jgi:hypothetical protein
VSDGIRWLVANNELFVPLFFIAFFVGAFIAAFFYRRRFVREGYVAVFFVLLLLVNLSPAAFVVRPMEDLHKFSHVAPDEEVNHLIYVEDTAGRELRFDRRVVPTVSPASAVARGLATRCDPAAATAAGRYLLIEARDYRDRIENDSVRIGAAIDFPRHQADYRWTRDRLEPYGPFVALRVYEVRLRYAENGRTVATEERRAVFEVRLPPTATHEEYPYTFEERCE